MENRDLKETISSLKFQLDQLRKLVFGSKQERFVPQIPNEQLNLFSETILLAPVEEEKQKIMNERKKAKKHPSRNPLPDHLPVNQVIIEPVEELEGMKKFGEDVTDTLDYNPASLVIRRTIRPRYVGIDTDGIERITQALAPSRPINKSIAEASLLAHILVAKFVMHLPFYRQIQRFKRDYQLNLHKNTINDWFVSVCTLLDPLYQTMVKKVVNSQYIQADESPIKVQDGEKKGTTHRGYQWVYHSPEQKKSYYTIAMDVDFTAPMNFWMDIKAGSKLTAMAFMIKSKK